MDVWWSTYLRQRVMFWFKYLDTNLETQIYRYKYRNTNMKINIYLRQLLEVINGCLVEYVFETKGYVLIQIRRYKFRNTNIQIQL